MNVEIREQREGAGAVARAILDRLPDWFGIPEANEEYVADAEREGAVIASADDGDVGILVLLRHTPYAAEVHLMAVVPELHRHGIGRLLLQHAERRLAAEGIEFLQVKTLSAASPDPNYAKTRRFYEAYGFRPLQEFPDLWHPSNPALQLVKVVEAGAANEAAPPHPPPESATTSRQI